MIKNLPTTLLIICGLLIGGQILAQTTTHEFMYDGLERNYRVYTPGNFDQSEQLPLVFNLHGYTSNAFEQELYSGMNAVADTGRFVVCYPNGIDESWNVGWLINSGADDLGFLETLIDTLAANYNIDRSRVYSCGMSNGGFMSYHLACNLPEKVAAIASVTGSMVPGTIATCDPNPVRPVMQIHGTEDGTVGYNGTPFIAEPIEDVIDLWVGLNNCSMQGDTTPYADINTSDNCTAERIDYTDCDDNKMVSFIKIEGGEHTWPDGAIDIGVTNRDFNASSTIWQFFQQYENNLVTSSTTPTLASSIHIYPNPAQDKLQIDVNLDTRLDYRIIGMDGKIYQNGRLNSDVLDISTLTEGMFVLEIRGEEGVMQEMFVRAMR